MSMILTELGTFVIHGYRFIGQASVAEEYLPDGCSCLVASVLWSSPTVVAVLVLVQNVSDC